MGCAYRRALDAMASVTAKMGLMKLDAVSTCSLLHRLNTHLRSLLQSHLLF